MASILANPFKREYFCGLIHRMRKVSFLVFFLTILLLKGQAPLLNVGGTIVCEDNKNRGGALVSVTKDGKHFTSFPTSSEGTYHLYLPLGSDYTINVSKKGYIKKMFNVSTIGVPQEPQNRQFPVIITDIELLEHYPGLDYSLFDQPMNKYYFNSEKDNFEYDKAYLEKMLALVEDFKEARKNAMLLAKQKAEQAKLDSALAKQKALQEEMMAVQAEMFKKMEQELADAAKQKAQKSNSATPQSEIANKPVPQPIEALSFQKSGQNRITGLLLKYKPGVSEELFVGRDVIVVQRVVVRDDMAWVYHKKIFSWGGVAFFRDGQPITESTFELETKRNS